MKQGGNTPNRVTCMIGLITPILHAVLLVGTTTGQTTCHGLRDSEHCALFYSADPDGFCDNE